MKRLSVIIYALTSTFSTDMIFAAEKAPISHITSQQTVPVFEAGTERIWELAGKFVGNATQHSTAIVEFAPGGQSTKHLHPIVEESYYVMEGEGVVFLNDVEHTIKKGDLIVIPANTWHVVFNKKSEILKLYVVATPAWTPDCMIFETK